MLFSTFLISPALKPVTVRLCFGLVKSGPTGPLSSEIGALVEGLLLLVSLAIVWEELRVQSCGEEIIGILGELRKKMRRKKWKRKKTKQLVG